MGKISLRCDACKYKFTRSMVPNLCPFCGKQSIREDSNRSAEDILHEVDEIERNLR